MNGDKLKIQNKASRRVGGRQARRAGGDRRARAVRAAGGVTIVNGRSLPASAPRAWATSARSPPWTRSRAARGAGRRACHRRRPSCLRRHRSATTTSTCAASRPSRATRRTSRCLRAHTVQLHSSHHAPHQLHAAATAIALTAPRAAMSMSRFHHRSHTSSL